MKTQEQLFLDWCNKNNLTYKKLADDNREYDNTLYSYEIVMDYIMIGDAKFKINPVQKTNIATFRFKKENGKFCSGTNLFWNTGLDWC